MMMRVKSSVIPIMILGFALLVALGGCGGGPSAVVRSNFIEFTPEQQEEIASRSSNEYRIQEGDILKVAFSYQTELNQNGIVVLPDGAVSLVGVDRIEVAGLTMTQADSLVTQAYAKDYREPNLSIIIQETQGRRVYVMGEVRNPGIHQVPSGGIDMLGAVTVAGGFSEDASKAGTVLVRVTPDGYLVQEIDMSDFTSMASAGLATIQIQPYDVIYVPRSRIGDFAYFSKTVLAGLVQITRIASDINYISGGSIQRVF